MNYYKRHLGDYAKKTRTLTVLQHGIYTLLLDLYYSEEAPVTAADAYTVCQARTAKDRAAVDTILAKFFTPDGELWRNPKADEVIGKYHARAPKNAESGRLGGIAKAQRNASDSLEIRKPHADISQKPEAIKEPTAAAPPRVEFSEDFEETFADYPKRAGDNPKRAAWRSWGARRAEGHSAAALRSGALRYAAWCRATGKIGTETVMQAKRFFGPDRPFLNAWTIGGEKPVRPPNCVMCQKDSTRRLEGMPYCDDHKPVERVGPQIASLAAAKKVAA